MMRYIVVSDGFPFASPPERWIGVHIIGPTYGTYWMVPGTYEENENGM